MTPAMKTGFLLIALGLALITLAMWDGRVREIEDRTVIDLSHAYNEETVYWPTAPSTFSYETLSAGETEGGWYYAAGAFATPEHGGTHMDAPVHFHRGAQAIDQVPVSRLVGKAVVIDVAARAVNDPDYRLSVEDIRNFEARHGTIEAGSIVLLRTGWSQYWPDAKAYLGDDRPGRADDLHFPSFGADAARLLIEERGIAMLGVDTASIDYGQSRDFPVHRIAGARDVPGLENLTNLDKLPPTGATVIALPMKIEGGSGGPVRAIALIGD